MSWDGEWYRRAYFDDLLTAVKSAGQPGMPDRLDSAELVGAFGALAIQCDQAAMEAAG